jgi:hypothetical protein
MATGPIEKIIGDISGYAKPIIFAPLLFIA